MTTWWQLMHWEQIQHRVTQLSFNHPGVIGRQAGFILDRSTVCDNTQTQISRSHSPSTFQWSSELHACGGGRKRTQTLVAYGFVFKVCHVSLWCQCLLGFTGPSLDIVWSSRNSSPSKSSSCGRGGGECGQTFSERKQLQSYSLSKYCSHFSWKEC